VHSKLDTPTGRFRLGAATLAVAAASAPALAEPIIGLTSTNALATFDSSRPGDASALNPITGLQAANERILAIDARPTTGLLYGVSNLDRVYTLAPTGAASFVGALTASLGSDVVGIDFNPVADLSGAASLRIISSAGLNLAFNVNNGVTAVQSPIEANLAANAYSNNDVDPTTGTALYYIDAVAGALKVATSAFNAPVINTVGALGVAVGRVADFDISVSGASFAALTDATGRSSLYRIDLQTGAAGLLGAFGIGGNTANAPALTGLTVTPIPEPETYALMVGGLLAMGAVARRRQRAAKA
jgi:hypothetical protein